MNTLFEALAGQMGTIVNGVVALGSGLVIWRLTNWSRDRADRQVELAVFLEQADAFILAVADIRAMAAVNRRLWEHPVEQARFVALAVFAAVAEGARVQVFGGNSRQVLAAAGGAVAKLALSESRASKAAVAALRGPMLRVHEAAVPFLRHADERVVETTNELLVAMGDIKDTARLEAALAAFGQVVVAVTEPRASRWTRLRSRTSRRLTRTVGN
ncbi:hypothetical protein ACFWCA_19305 [Streptomyces phaeochromogenes]|uniref:hypothetical protein n=1 Tax=Streptomyces phaeochromogenes TaxID=1923 RepID=UPI00369EAD8A